MQPFQPGRPPAFRGASYYGPPPPGAFVQAPAMGPPPAFRGMAPPRGAFLPPHLMAPPRAFPVAAAVAPTLPAGWTEHFTPQGVRYYYNAVTRASTYDLASIQAVSAGTTAPSVAPSSAGPAASATGTWVEYTDDASGKPYYYNTLTKVTTWEQPEEYRMQQARAQVEKMQSSTAAVTTVEAEETKQKQQKKREADDRAAETFKSMSKEERVLAFKAFLEEKEVSPQFKWQEAQRFVTKEGLDSDPRWKFALSTAGEKKQAFAEYCTQAINKQTIERRRQAKRVREEFLDLMAAVVEEQMRHRRVSWDDVNQGPEFYGLRKDQRWLAVEETKDRKDLFESFVQDVARKRSQQEAKYRENVKSRVLVKLREAFADSKAVSSNSRRRLDSDTKLKAWSVFEDVEREMGDEKRSGVVHKQDVYEWAEDVLATLRSEEHEKSKVNREKRRLAEDEFASILDKTAQQWVSKDNVSVYSSWKDVQELVNRDLAQDTHRAVLSDRRQRRQFEKSMKRVREHAKPDLPLVKSLLARASFGINATTTFEEFAKALLQGVQAVRDENQPEDGEEVKSSPTTAASADAPSTVNQPLQQHLEEIVRSATELDNAVKELPASVKVIFQILVHDSQRDAPRPDANGRERERSRSRSRSHSASPSASSRKRRRSSIESRSRSRTRSRSRSASRKPSAKRRASRSRSQDPRAGNSVPSYDNLPRPSTMSHTFNHHTSSTKPIDESAKAEEIIRQARLKLQAKQEAKQRGEAAADDSELEEGEELEDGEISE